jgi:predicted phosphodiesterase
MAAAANGGTGVTFMRILAVSDMHGNIEAVRRVRERERNEFDAVLVPGDIGGREHAGEILALLSSFACPVLYVYGNADYELSYDEEFGKSRHHLHLKSLRAGDFTFIGMSGCAANWGRNPAALATYAEIDRRHHAILAAREEAEADFAKARAEIDAAHATKVKRASLTAADRRKRAFRERLARLEEKRGSSDREGGERKGRDRRVRCLCGVS